MDRETVRELYISILYHYADENHQYKLDMTTRPIEHDNWNSDVWKRLPKWVHPVVRNDIKQ